MTHRHDAPPRFATRLRLDDEIDDDDDDESGDDDEESDDDDEDSDDDDEDEEDEETETWQVSVVRPIPLKGASGLTSGIDLPRLAGIYQLS